MTYVGHKFVVYRKKGQTLFLQFRIEDAGKMAACLGGLSAVKEMDLSEETLGRLRFAILSHLGKRRFVVAV